VHRERVGDEDDGRRWSGAPRNVVPDRERGRRAVLTSVRRLVDRLDRKHELEHDDEGCAGFGEGHPGTRERDHDNREDRSTEEKSRQDSHEHGCMNALRSGMHVK
jgi:hypothetical protein